MLIDPDIPENTNYQQHTARNVKMKILQIYTNSIGRYYWSNELIINSIKKKCARESWNENVYIICSIITKQLNSTTPYPMSKNKDSLFSLVLCFWSNNYSSFYHMETEKWENSLLNEMLLSQFLFAQDSPWERNLVHFGYFMLVQDREYFSD